MPGSRLLSRILEISQKSHLDSVAVAFYDYSASIRFSYHGDRSFHAASTFKAGILFALLKAVEAGKVRLDDPLHVRNRFTSIVDGSPYRIDRDRDGDAMVHRHVGRSMPIESLARVMITRSSNLATNLLLDLLGISFIRTVLEEAGAEGLEIRRGVEDNVAYQQGINNETTAEGLVRLFRLFLDEDHLPQELRDKGLEMLLAQEFKSMIPARLPAGVRVAHKTGEISTHCHDAGIVFVPDREPYVVAIMTESTPSNSKRKKAVADLSAVVHRYVSGCYREERLHE